VRSTYDTCGTEVTSTCETDTLAPAGCCDLQAPNASSPIAVILNRANGRLLQTIGELERMLIIAPLSAPQPSRRSLP
jgi:hypothetical protein